MNGTNKPNILKECVDHIEKCKRESQEGDLPYSEGDTDKGFEITEERIFKVPPCRDIRKLGFVDGGTGTILSGADFSISLNRIAGVLFENNKVTVPKKIPEIIEFYTTTIIEPLDDDTMIYHIRIFPREPIFEKFLPFDSEISLPLKEVRALMGFRTLPAIESFGGVAMRFAEWVYATKFIENELDKGDIVVRDGSLQTGFKDEILLVRELYSIANEKEMYATRLSKTCRLITKKGDALMSLIFDWFEVLTILL